MGKGRRAITYAIVIVLLLGAGGVYVRRAQQRREFEARPEVTLARVSTGDVRVALSLSGKAEPIQRSILKAPAAGKLIFVLAEGVNARQNQVVARIENGPDVTAPFPGLIVSSQLTAGEFVTAGQNLMALANNNIIVIRTSIDELDYHRVSLSQPVSVTFEAVPGRSFVGKVTRKALEARAQGDISLFDVWVEIDQPTDVLLGMTADLEVVFSEVKNVVRAPNEAIFSDEGTAYVYVVDADMVAAKQQVVVGAKNVSFTEIKSGLSSDQRVITSNLGIVGDGGKVRLRAAQRNNAGLLFRR